MTPLAFQDQVLFPLTGLAIEVLPDEAPLYVLGERATAREDIRVSVPVKVRDGQGVEILASMIGRDQMTLPRFGVAVVLEPQDAPAYQLRPRRYPDRRPGLDPLPRP